MIDITGLREDKRPQSSTIVHALLDRLEAAEKDVALKEKMIDALSSARNAIARELVELRLEISKQQSLTDAAQHKADKLSARVEEAEKERDALRAKIAEMERQEPARLVTPTAYRWRCRGSVMWQYGELTEETVRLAKEHNREVQSLYTLPGAQQCKNCNGTGDRFDPSGEKIPCDLCESHLEEIRSLVAEAAHDIISGSDFWLSISLAAKKIYALPGAKGEEK